MSEISRRGFAGGLLTGALARAAAQQVKTAPGKPASSDARSPHHRGGFSPDGAEPTRTGRTP